jgi:hypothetical protein
VQSRGQWRTLRHVRTRHLIVCAGAFVFLAACSGTKESTSAAPASVAATGSSVVTLPSGSTQPAAAPGEAAPQGGAPAVPEILQYKAKQLGAGEVDLASFAGKPTAFWFWAPT